MLLPGYVAVVTFHPERIPRMLLPAFLGSVSATPLSAMGEAFGPLLYELLREAGLRLPDAMGIPSVVGGIVIGDAIVTAGLVGLPMIIIIALTAVSAFAVPSLYEPVTILRFLFIFIGGILGLYGMVLGFLVLVVNLCSLHTLGTAHGAHRAVAAPPCGIILAQRLAAAGAGGLCPPPASGKGGRPMTRTREISGSGQIFALLVLSGEGGGGGGGGGGAGGGGGCPGGGGAEDVRGGVGVGQGCIRQPLGAAGRGVGGRCRRAGALGRAAPVCFVFDCGAAAPWGAAARHGAQSPPARKDLSRLGEEILFILPRQIEPLLLLLFAQRCSRPRSAAPAAVGARWLAAGRPFCCCWRRWCWGTTAACSPTP